MHNIPAQPAIDGFQFPQGRGQIELNRWINSVIARNTSDAFWILSSVKSTFDKLECYTTHFNDCCGMNSAVPAFKHSNGILYFMWSTSDRFHESIDAYTLYLKRNEIKYVFIVPTFNYHDSRWMWKLAGGPKVQKVCDAAKLYPARKPRTMAEAMGHVQPSSTGRTSHRGSHRRVDSAPERDGCGRKK